MQIQIASFGLHFVEYLSWSGFLSENCKKLRAIL